MRTAKADANENLDPASGDRPNPGLVGGKQLENFEQFEHKPQSLSFYKFKLRRV